MATFLFASMPVPAHTTNPMPFARHLVDRGHTVLWLAGRVFHEQLATTGASPLPWVHTPDFGGREITEYFPQLTGSGPRVIGRAFADVFVGHADRRVRDIHDVLSTHRIDAIFSDGISYGPELVTELGGPPYASFGDGPLPADDPDVPPFGPGLRPMRGPLGRLRNRTVAALGRRVIFAAAQRRYEEIRRGLGLPGRVEVLSAAISPLLHLQGTTPGFEYPIPRLPAQIHWVGALRPDPRPWQPPQWWPGFARDDRPLVALSQGSIRPDHTELLVPTIKALADSDVRVVAVTGASTPEALIADLGGTVPSNVKLARFIPYDELLRRSAVFVTNGGYTGVTLALSHGVPIVQAGTTEEKSEIGARIEWTGVGLRLGTTRPSPKRLRAAVHRVLHEPAFRAAAAGVRREMSVHDAGTEGAVLLEQLALTGSPVLRGSETAHLAER